MSSLIRRPRFALIATDAGWHFVLRAPNGETVCVSESYTTRQACLEGIGAVKRYSLPARIQHVDARV